MCRLEYGVAPEIEIDGNVTATFPYITTPLNYIVPEMLKNAFRLVRMYLLLLIDVDM